MKKKVTLVKNKIDSIRRTLSNLKNKINLKK